MRYLHVLSAGFFSVLLVACARGIFPLGREARTAYHEQLKKMRAGYDRFIPVKLPPDALAGGLLMAPSPNFNIRHPEMVVIHHTAQGSCLESLKTLTDPAAAGRVSSHYLICKDGTVYQLVSEQYRAWHAGVARWGNMHDVNSASIGIELDNNGREPFPEAQIRSLLTVLRSLEQRYHIPTGNFVGHGDVAPVRKDDPSRFFPWAALADSGYGYWYDTTLADLPADFDCSIALRLIGYDVRNLPAATAAFKRHFIPGDTTEGFSPYDQKMLYNIFLKYAQ